MVYILTQMEQKQKNNKMKKTRLIGAALGIIAYGLGWYWFGFKLVVVLFLAIWGNNMERK